MIYPLLLMLIVASSAAYADDTKPKPLIKKQISASTQPPVPKKATQWLQASIPAVVSIHVEHEIQPRERRPHDDTPSASEPTHSFGTGFFIDQSGVLLTNAHVVMGAKSIVARDQNGNDSMAQVVGIDPVMDLAVLRTSLRSAHFLSMEEGADASVGDTVYAIGSSFGLPQSVTSGIVSALHRSISSPLQDFIQTDSAINQGNSGGPLINQHGHLIGVNTMIIGVAGGNNGVGFAIPLPLVRNVAEQILHDGKIKPAKLGVHVQNLSLDMARALGASKVTTGVVVTDVVPGSAADTIGMKNRDIITHFNKQPIATAAQLAAAVYTTRQGSDAALTVVRQNKVKQITGTLATDQSKGHEPMARLFDGVGLARYEAIDPSGKAIRGLQVLSTVPNSQGWLSGLHTGDTILRVGKTRVTELTDLARIKLTSSPILIELIRGHRTVFLVLNSPTG